MQAASVSRHTGSGAQSQGPQRESDGLRGDQVAPKRRRPSIPAPLSSVAGRRLPWRGQGCRLGREDPGVECRARRASTKARSQRGAAGLGQGVYQRRGEDGLGEVHASVGLPGAASKVGGGEDDSLDRPEQEDEQGLREAVRQRGSVRLRGNDTFDGEEVSPCLRISKQFQRNCLAKLPIGPKRHPIRVRNASFCPISEVAPQPKCSVIAVFYVCQTVSLERVW